MRILIFGGSGFLGQSLVPMLEARGHEVLRPRRAEFDLTEPQVPRDAHRDVDAVIHAAALYGGMPFDLARAPEILVTNTRMNVNAFDYAHRVSARRVVTIGSACAYPGYLDKDFVEEDLFTGPLHDTVACHGFTKLAMVVAHQVYWNSHGLPGTHLIPANLYGPHDVYTIERSHVVAALIRKYTDALASGGDVRLMGDGSPVREFLYVADLAEMIVRSLEADPDGVELVNAGTGRGHTIRELAAIIAEQLGFTGRTLWDPAQPNGAQRKVMSPLRTQRHFAGFTPLALEAGIAKTLAWYRPNKTEADARQ